jgi:NAD(P)-dependent dehydrogenase (short-subunit alcohol dehydrogenase family)
MASKVIIVTGASRGCSGPLLLGIHIDAEIGIGLAVATFLAKRNHKLVLVSRTEGPLNGLKDRATPGSIAVVPADLTNLGAGAAIVEAAIQKYGRLDGLIVNHGTLGPVNRLSESTAQDWREAFNVNFFSAVDLVKAALPELRKSQGKIVVTSSGAATNAYTAWGAYGASKAAINHLVATLEVEEPDITAVAVRPGTVDTEMQREIREKHNLAMDPQDATKFANLKKDGKLLQPEQPGNVIARLVLDAPKELSGRFISYVLQRRLAKPYLFRWNDEELDDFQDDAQ